jgi:hypothetical protein
MTDLEPVPTRTNDPTSSVATAIGWGIRPVRATSPGFRQWLGRAPRAPRTRIAMALAVAAAVLWLIGPVCWRFASRELDAIDRGKVRAPGRPWIAFAEWCGIVATFLAIATIGFVATVAIRRAF